MKFIFLYLLLFVLYLFAYSQNKDTKKELIPIKDTSRSSFLILPIAYSSPETRWGFGIAGTYFLRNNKNYSEQRTSSLRGMGVYTLNKQIIVDCGITALFKNEDYILKVSNLYINYPDKFYGVGNNVRPDNFEFYTSHQLEIYPRILKRIYRKYYLGLQYRYCNLFDVKYKQNGIFDNMNLLGESGGLSSGIGVLIDYDSRNNYFNSYRGSYLNISYMYYNKIVGSKFDYRLFTFDYRKYYAFYKLYVLAFQVYSNINYGQPPFRELALMGGNSLMRGVYKGMYRDRKYIASQVELRIPIWQRFGAVTFAGIGEIGDKLANFDYYNAKLSYGVGLRFMAIPDERVNLRIDYAISKPTNGWYFTVTEAF